MKVKNLQVDGFGVWTELDLQALSHRVTIVFGANETGKTTLMQFIRSMLYGFSPERRDRYLPPVHGGRAGGSLDVDAAHGGLRIQRHLDRLGLADEEEDLVVQSDDGANVSVSLLSHLLAGVDEATFNNVFAVGLRELQELGTLDDTKAADLLYKLTTGLDRVSLIDVMRDLSDVRRTLFDPRDESSRIPVLVQRRDQLQERMEALANEGRQWIELQSHLVALDGEAHELEQRTGQWDEQPEGAGRGAPRAANCGASAMHSANNWRRSASCAKFPTRRSNASRPCGKWSRRTSGRWRSCNGVGASFAARWPLSRSTTPCGRRRRTSKPWWKWRPGSRRCRRRWSRCGPK